MYDGPERRTQDVPVARERRKVGRPPLVEGDEPSSLRIRLPTALHDQICLAALRNRQSVSAIVRDALERIFQPPIS